MDKWIDGKKRIPSSASTGRKSGKNESTYNEWIKLSGLGIVSVSLFIAIFLTGGDGKMAKMRTVTRTKRDNGVTADRITPLFLQRVARKNSKIELRFRKFVETEKDATWATWAMTLARHRWHQLQECLSPYSVENNHYVKSLRDTEWRLTIPYIILLLLILPIKLVF